MTEEAIKAIAEIRALVAKSKHTVFFGGAGVSTASGIPDFRGTNGLYESSYRGLPPEYLLSDRCLKTAPQLFFDYYKHNMLYPKAKPNAAHYALVEMEKNGLLDAVVTQNIDGLHSQAGSKTVYELHGMVKRNYCMRCGKAFAENVFETSDAVPVCDCGGIVRPDVVLYGEGLDGAVFSKAGEAIEKAEVLIVGGTSLTVNPAASLVWRYHGSHLIIVNYSETPCDSEAEYLIRESVADVLPMLI